MGGCINMLYKYCVYHSYQWECLTLLGYVTMAVDTLGGVQIATMIKQGGVR